MPETPSKNAPHSALDTASERSESYAVPSVPDSFPKTLQALAPECARFCLDAERFLRAELSVDPAGQHLLVALSGGADSTALLLTLHYLTPRLGCTLSAAHLDHSLRPESEQEAVFARSLCHALGIPCATARRDVADLARETGTGLEEAGREARLSWFEDVRADTGAEWIALAHQADDLAEDVVMRLIRGTGWPGLGGMAGADADRHILRPLLHTPRTAIESFLAGVGMPYVTDGSNTDPAFLRNRVRHTIMPLLKAENPRFLEAVSGLWQVARMDEAHFQDILAPALDMVGCSQLSDDFSNGYDSFRHSLDKVSTNRRFVSDHRLAELDRTSRTRLYKLCLDLLGPGQALQDAVFRLDAGWMEKRVGRVYQFPGGKTVTIQSDGLLFEGRKSPGR